MKEKEKIMNNYIITESSKNLRLLARRAMADNWKPAILAAGIFLICTTLPVAILNQMFGVSYTELMGIEMYASDAYGNQVSVMSELYTVLVNGAFSLGLSIFFIELVRNKKVDLGYTFAGFEHFFKALGLFIVMAFFTVLWTCLFIVPGIIAAIRYSQAFYILADDPNKGIMECIAESKQMMKGNKAKFFCMGLSFIGWELLAGVFVGVLSGIATLIVPGEMVYSILTSIIGVIGMSGLVAYIYGTQTIFYEMLNGNLRPAASDEFSTLS